MFHVYYMSKSGKQVLSVHETREEAQTARKRHNRRTGLRGCLLNVSPGDGGGVTGMITKAVTL